MACRARLSTRPSQSHKLHKRGARCTPFMVSSHASCSTCSLQHALNDSWEQRHKISTMCSSSAKHMHMAMFHDASQLCMSPSTCFPARERKPAAEACCFRHTANSGDWYTGKDTIASNSHGHAKLASSKYHFSPTGKVTRIWLLSNHSRSESLMFSVMSHSLAQRMKAMW